MDGISYVDVRARYLRLLWRSTTYRRYARQDISKSIEKQYMPVMDAPKIPKPWLLNICVLICSQSCPSLIDPPSTVWRRLRPGHTILEIPTHIDRCASVSKSVVAYATSLHRCAHVYIDTNEEDAAAKLRDMGGAQAIVTTIGHAPTVSTLMTCLAPQCRIVLLGAGKDPLSVSAGHLVVGERSVLGSITGSPYENEKTLDFSVLTDVRPWGEIMPLEQAYDAYQRMKSGDVKFRMVLSISNKK